jgi:hypothetical protein
MIEFWDIDFDDETIVEENFIEGLLKLGFVKRNPNIYTKEIVNLHGDLVEDGVFIDLESSILIFTPEPKNHVKIKIGDRDINRVDKFIRNNVI